MVVEALVPLLEYDQQGMNEDYSASIGSELNQQVNHKVRCSSKDNLQAGGLWTDGLICAFEFIRGSRKMHSAEAVREVAKKKGEVAKKKGNQINSVERIGFYESSLPVEPAVVDIDDSDNNINCGKESLPRSYWKPIGWARISELVLAVHSDANWASQPHDFTDDESDVPVADVATPYWERPVGPTWWCHLDAGDPFVKAWLGSSQWLHPAISIALQDEGRLISDRMKHLLYEVNKLVLFESICFYHFISGCLQTHFVVACVLPPWLLCFFQ